MTNDEMRVGGQNRPQGRNKRLGQPRERGDQTATEVPGASSRRGVPGC